LVCKFEIPLSLGILRVTNFRPFASCKDYYKPFTFSVVYIPLLYHLINLIFWPEWKSNDTHNTNWISREQHNTVHMGEPKRLRVLSVQNVPFNHMHIVTQNSCMVHTYLLLVSNTVWGPVFGGGPVSRFAMLIGPLRVMWFQGTN
jgi:hypothetical protein